MQELASNNLMIEDWGGDVPAVQVLVVWDPPCETTRSPYLEFIRLSCSSFRTYFYYNNRMYQPLRNV